jgi:hypothetical protein
MSIGLIYKERSVEEAHGRYALKGDNDYPSVSE